MNALEIYLTMARYNRWMNDKVYAASETLSDEARKRDLHAPFRSVHGTLNHLLLTDRIWLGRFTGQPYPFQTLADELYTDFDLLRQERGHTDDAIDAWVDTLTAEQLSEPFRYMSAVNPQPRAYPLWVCVQHVFNHQTHHRGQLTTLLEQLGADSGVTDLIWLPGVQLPVSE